MFPQEACEDKPATKGHDGKSKRQIHKWKPTKADRVEHEVERHYQARHFQPDQAALRGSAEAHVGARNKGSRYRAGSDQPEIHCGSVAGCAPSSLVILGTVLRSS